MRMNTLLGASLIWLLLSFPLWAKDALTPAEAPQIFMESVYKLNYKEAWSILSAESQAHFVDTVIKMEKNNALNTVQVKNYFANDDRALRRGFWNQFRRSMDVLAWSEQKFSTGEVGPDGLVWVNVEPANIRVLAKQEGSNWKFAFYETFVKPKQPTPPQASGKPTSKPSSKPSSKPGR